MHASIAAKQGGIGGIHLQCMYFSNPYCVICQGSEVSQWGGCSFWCSHGGVQSLHWGGRLRGKCHDVNDKKKIMNNYARVRTKYFMEFATGNWVVGAEIL